MLSELSSIEPVVERKRSSKQPAVMLETSFRMMKKSSNKLLEEMLIAQIRKCKN